MRQFSITLLLFTFFTSLASGQWEADQFLFEKKNEKSRPKPVASETKNEKPKNKNHPIVKTVPPVMVNEPIPEPAQQDKNPQGRDPASLQDAVVSMNARVGYIDFLSKSTNTPLAFSTGTYSLGAHLGIGFDAVNSMQVSYAGTAELQSAFDWNGQSVNHLKWEDIGIQYSYHFLGDDHELHWGPIYRKNTWWGQIAGTRTSLERIEGYGVHGLYLWAKQNNFRHQIQWQALPYVQSLESDQRGFDMALDWVSDYAISSKRALVIQLGFEKLQLSSQENSPSGLDQRIIKFFVGYKISTH